MVLSYYHHIWRPRQPIDFFRVQTIPLTFQDMLGLLVRPDIGVIVIEGIGGSGKTWAAKAAYQASRSLNLFEEYIWVSLSINCSMTKCINKIAASLPCNRRDEFFIGRTKAIIKEYLRRRKFLLVLDNTYFTEESILEYLGVPCPQQQNLGSKIIVTTRTRRATSIMEPDIVITPEPLTYEDSYDLLREKIGKPDISSTHDLIRYCYGIPLIIILLAGVLCDAPTQGTFSELVTNTRVALRNQISVFNTMQHIVKFAYYQLPNDNVRHCLLYCLLFPEDRGITVKELIQYWIMDVLQETIDFDEAKHVGKEILDVLIKRGMVYLDDNDHVRMHDVIRETVSRFGKEKGYNEQHDWYFRNPIITLEHHATYSERVSLMDTEMGCLHGSPRCFFLTSLLLRRNYLLKSISEEFFCHMGRLDILDLSFTLIEVIPPSISCLTWLPMLLLSGCDFLKEIKHIAPLVRLEVLDASGCSSLKSVSSGSFDFMVLLKILDLSATSITSMTSIPASMELRQLNLQNCPFVGSELHYGVSKGGAVRNLHLGDIEDLEDWMSMMWLPRGLTFKLSDKFGMKVSLDSNRDGNSYVYATNAYFFNCLRKDSPLWFNCFQKFQIVISPLMDNQTTDTDSIFQNSFFRTKHFAHSIEPVRYLEINGTVGVPSDLDGVLCHAELISLKRLAMTTQFSDLNITSMESLAELWVENCVHLESLLSVNDVLAISAMGNLQNLWISNMENLSSFCKGMDDVTSFSCLKHLLLDCCPNLTYLFPSALCLPNLETLNIKFCDILERVFDSSVLGEDTLPRLQSLQLWELPELTCVCGGVLPSLRNLKVRGCVKLRKIPVGVNENSPFVTTTGEQVWWDSLLWDDKTIKRWLLFRNWGPLLPQLATEG
ncbi:hypothetical protein BS78_03G305600 [Paspalum vaginatum]|nr:hypothetical protein BS78_03G305600 [Paspalum vaginatum]